MSFLGIKITHETGRLLSAIDVPGEKTGVADYHITLLCFEDNWEISNISKALEVSYDVISKIKPFLIETKTISCFPQYKDNPVAIIAKIQSDELYDLRDKLAKEYDKHNLEFSKTFKTFKPHITLSYNDKEIEDCEIDTVEFSVNELVLYGGDQGDDRIFITFPLKSPEKHSSLLKQIKMFEKMSFA